MGNEPQIKGIVIEALPSTLFRVELEDGKVIICHLAGKLRVNHIRILPGDRVSVVLDPYGDKGRIVFRG